MGRDGGDTRTPASADPEPMNPPIDLSVFRPFRRLVRITVLGVPLDVPEDNSLLRCFQYVCPPEVSTGRFCWNGDCGNSAFTYKLPGDPRVHHARACRLLVREGMEITELSPELAWVLRRVVPLPAASGDAR